MAFEEIETITGKTRSQSIIAEPQIGEPLTGPVNTSLDFQTGLADYQLTQTQIYPAGETVFHISNPSPRPSAEPAVTTAQSPGILPDKIVFNYSGINIPGAKTDITIAMPVLAKNKSNPNSQTARERAEREKQRKIIKQEQGLGAGTKVSVKHIPGSGDVNVVSRKGKWRPL